ncbi:MAG: methylisocitrate lyase [Proteobacteria bacterium SW_6_67_9]|nr:MAG: methylisocitrate lyase [Proteobacteria bacterium SW_6_67_9]
MAQQIGHRALYLSGGGVANASYGLPDLGMTEMNDVLADVRRITAVTDTPLLVDIDTGFGGALAIGRTMRSMIDAGAAAVHMEDQIVAKRCGHRPNKAVVSTQEMSDRIKAAVDARTDDAFFLVARTDALALEGRGAAIERARAYAAAGADAIFVEAATDIADYTAFRTALGETPLLANMTEFGRTPLYSQRDLADAGVDMVLYPLSAFRAMSRAAEAVYSHILSDGDQRAVTDAMQTRDELYRYLGYHAYEARLDALSAAPGRCGEEETP